MSEVVVVEAVDAGPSGLRAAARQALSSDGLGWSHVHASVWEEQPEAELVDIPASDEHRLVMVTRGTYVIESRCGTRWRRALCGPGSIGVTEAGHADVLRWRGGTTEQLQSVHVRLDTGVVDDARESFRSRGSHAYPDALQLDDPRVRGSVRDLLWALRSSAPPMYAESIAHVLAARLVTTDASLGPGAASGLDPRVLARVVDHLQTHLGELISLDDLAAVANLSKHHLLRQFKAATGQTPHRFLRQLRMEHAKRLLSGGDLPVRSVARVCGYASDRQFGEAFTRHTGSTPARWRTGSS